MLAMNTALLTATAVSENQVDAKLVADVSSVSPGETFRLGVLFELPERAHIYWRNPGDSGLATGVEWQLNGDLAADELQWPNPRRFELSGLDDVNHGYERAVLLFSDMTAANDASGDVAIAARAYWLLCLDDGECIPEEIELSLTLPVASSSKRSEDVALFEQYAAQVPASINKETPLTIRLDPKSRELSVAAMPPWKTASADGDAEANFFPDEGPAWERIKPIGLDSVIFRRPGEDEGEVSGVLTMPLRQPGTGETRTVYALINKLNTQSR